MSDMKLIEILKRNCKVLRRIGHWKKYLMRVQMTIVGKVRNVTSTKNNIERCKELDKENEMSLV